MNLQDPRKVVLISGHPSPEQINELQGQYDISPEFWRRHLDPILTTSTTTFEDTKVPSAACDIIQLRFWTIGSRGYGRSEAKSSIDSIRDRAETLMDLYREQMTGSLHRRTGDSIVRSYEIHDREYFSIEQVITIALTVPRNEIQQDESSRWTGELYSD